MIQLRRTPAALRLTLLLTLPLLAVAGCSSGSHATTTTSSPSGQVSRTGVEVTGAFGTKPTLKIPATAAPKQLDTEILTEGTRGRVVSGQTIVVNYLGETWDLKSGQPNVFNNTFDSKQPAGFPIGIGAVIKGFDQGLVGQQVGSRILLVIPPSLAYATSDGSSNELVGKALVFVVDIIDVLNKGLAATGSVVHTLPAGYPQITSVPGKEPTITSVKGVKVGKTQKSALLLKGTGAPIDPAKVIALEVVETDLKTGKELQRTWDIGPLVTPAQQVLALISALSGQRIGSRAIAITPSQDSSVGIADVVDVVGQY